MLTGLARQVSVIKAGLPPGRDSMEINDGVNV